MIGCKEMASIVDTSKILTKGWKTKIPVVSAILYSLFSLPFLLDLPIASIHESGAYSIVYMILNLPVLVLFDRFKFDIESSLNHPTNYTMYLLFFVFSLLFWILVSFILGVFCDVLGQKKAKG
jgi:hypothetical protein